MLVSITALLPLTLPTLAASVAPAPRALTSFASVSDDDLVRRAQGGDRWAEEALYRKHVQYVGRIASRLSSNSSEVDDILQETFAIALEQLSSLRNGSAFRPWLAQIAVSQVRRRLRRQKLLRVLGFVDRVDEHSFESHASDAANGEVRAELAALGRVLESLPSEQRIAWVLRYAEGEANDDVARACGCSLATAKRRIAAADARVRAHVQITEDAHG